MSLEFQNCSQCGKQGRPRSVAIDAWFPSAPSGFVESLQQRLTGENLRSRIKEVKDYRPWAMIPFLVLVIFHKQLSDTIIIQIVMFIVMIVIYGIASSEYQISIGKVIDDFFPMWFDNDVVLTTKAANIGLFCNMCGRCWDRDSGEIIALYNKESEYRLYSPKDPLYDDE